MPPEQKSLKELILEKFDAKGLNLEKIFQATGVPRHYLEAISQGEWHKLPAAPYTRGYFKKLESLLELEPETLWRLYRGETEIRVSGATDKLPENRYAIKSKTNKLIWPIFAVAVVMLYLSFNASRLLGKPPISVASPPTATAITALPSYTFIVKIDPRDKLLINQEQVYVDKDGRFQEDYKLQPGLNTFELVAERFLGRKTKVVKQIIYQTPGQSE
jgi:hypothetical protein